MNQSDTLAAPRTLLQQGNLVRAKEQCERELSRNPYSGQAYDLLGLIICRSFRPHAVEVADLNSAINAFYRATQCPDREPRFYVHLAMFWAAIYNYQKALEIVLEAKSFFGRTSELDFIEARIQSLCLNPNAVRDAYERLLAQNTSDIELWESYCNAMYVAGNLDQAIAVFDLAYSRFPAIVSKIGLNYTILLKAVGRSEDYLRITAQFINLAESDSVRMDRRLAALEFDGNFRAAEELWRQLIERDPINTNRLFGIANNLARQCRYTDSMVFLDSAKTLLDQLPRHGALLANVNTLYRAVTDYVPRVINYAAITPSPPRIPGRDVIVIRGQVNGSNVDVIKHYRAAHEAIYIILSTWVDTDELLLRDLRPYVDEIVLNHQPHSPGIYSLNYQVICAAGGVRRAKEVGAERVLLTRTDLAFLKPNLLSEFHTALEDNQPNKERTPGLKRRLVICEIYTAINPFFQASDIFCYGTTEDILNYWDDSDEDTTCLRPEIYLMRRFCKKVGRDVMNDMGDSFAAMRDLFIIKDADTLQLFWLRYPAVSSQTVVATPPKYVSESIWRQRGNPFFVNFSELPLPHPLTL